ncbi:hypothetical protein [Streptomyces sp. NE06-03C]|uniref:hypothetical protein n=1 Tax=Streptomyces sp. NE06-03C TaxID=3028694 RepID=UPI0029B5237F|nr:hypothetical protein [Streptomyces sp. NE06-03C]MDX2922890.1 hypothetical protein [Streptomyces sp. NE06-03C]
MTEETWNSRQEIAEALEAAGWKGDPGDELGVLRHSTGAVWAVLNDSGDCGVDCPNGAVIEFPSATPDAVVIATALAASGQSDPAHVTELEERATWLGFLEAAGVDNWSGVDVAHDLRNEAAR